MIPDFVFTLPPSRWPLDDAQRAVMLELMARSLERGHTHTASSRPLNASYELTGVICEYAYARAFDMPMPRKDQWRGDKGIDFWIGLISIDVKGRASPRAMLVEQGKVNADIYVDAHYMGGNILDAQLIGWAWARDVKAIPAYDTGKGIINHKVTILRPIDELHMLAATAGFAA